MQVAWWEHLSKICSRIQGRGGQQHLVYKEFHTDFHFRIEASSVSKWQDLFTLLQCKTAQSPSRNVFSSALYTKKKCHFSEHNGYSVGAIDQAIMKFKCRISSSESHWSRNSCCSDMGPGGVDRFSFNLSFALVKTIESVWACQGELWGRTACHTSESVPVCEKTVKNVS